MLALDGIEMVYCFWCKDEDKLWLTWHQIQYQSHLSDRQVG